MSWVQQVPCWSQELKQKISLKDCGKGLEEEGKPLGLPSDGGNELYLSNQLPWKIIDKEIKFNSRSSRKITELAGKGLHLVGRCLFAPSRQSPVPWARQALERKVQQFVDRTAVGWLLSILLCLVPLRIPRG